MRDARLEGQQSLVKVQHFNSLIRSNMNVLSGITLFFKTSLQWSTTI